MDVLCFSTAESSKNPRTPHLGCVLDVLSSEVLFGTGFLSWLFSFKIALPSAKIFEQFGFLLRFNKMLPVQGQAEITHKVCGALDKYESKLSEINQKVCIIFGKHTIFFINVR